jgi:hypothetical protein
MNMHASRTAEAGQQVRLALRQARLLNPFYRRHQAFFRFVDSHQKWMLLHLIAESAGSAAEGPMPLNGIAATWIAERAGLLGIASRNTTLAFLGQLASYGYLKRQACRADGRMRLLAPSEPMRAILSEWTAGLVDTLGLARPAGSLAMTSVYGMVARDIVAEAAYRTPAADIRLVQSTRGGWLLMNDILCHVRPEDCGQRQLAVRDFSISRAASQHGLSRSTLYRLLRETAETGAFGWTRHCGQPVLWVDRDHLARFGAWNGLLLDAVGRTVGEAEGAQPTAGLTIFAPTARDAISAPATTLL